MENDALSLAERVFKEFKGIISREDNSISLTAKNLFFGKRVECKCIVNNFTGDNLTFKYGVDVFEKTYQIMGGRGYPCKDLEEVEEVLRTFLKGYHFEVNTQMNLFDFKLEELTNV